MSMREKRGSKGTTDRVNIHAEVETLNNGRVKVKVPFIMGVMASLSGANKGSLDIVARREFVEFDHANFDKRMEAIAPAVQCQVEDKIHGTGKLHVELTFRSMDDFSPGSVARNVEPLRRLLYMRQKLMDLKARSDGYPERTEARRRLLEIMKQQGFRNALGLGEKSKS